MLSTEMAPSNSSVHPVRGVKLKVIKKPTPFGMSFSILYGGPSHRDVVNAVFAWSKKLSPRLGSGGVWLILCEVLKLLPAIPAYTPSVGLS